MKPKHIWAIRQQLKASGRRRDLAMFNCAIDAKLRACDLVQLTVSDVAPGSVLRTRSTVIQQKTGRSVPFEITELTREAVAGWLPFGERGGEPALHTRANVRSPARSQRLRMAHRGHSRRYEDAFWQMEMLETLMDGYGFRG